MALLPINENIDITDSNETIRKLKFKKKVFGLKYPKINFTDVIPFHSSIQVFLLQEYIHQLFGIEIIFESDRKEINKFTCYNEIVTSYIASINDSLEKLNIQLHRFFNSIESEIRFQKENFENCYKNDNSMLDFDIKIKIDFILNENDLLFRDNSTNYIIKTTTWVLSEELDKFYKEYVKNEYIKDYNNSEIPCKNPHRILFELLQFLELEDLLRIGSFFGDIHYIRQKKCNRL